MARDSSTCLGVTMSDDTKTSSSLSPSHETRNSSTDLRRRMKQAKREEMKGKAGEESSLGKQPFSLPPTLTHSRTDTPALLSS